jgi:diketogulonate reductase-like aldo/keto reductase
MEMITAAGALPLAVLIPKSIHAQSDNVSTAPRMNARPIPSTGERLPVIGLGTWQTFDVGADAVTRAPLEEVLRAFVQLGGKLIDSSPMYGRAETVAGELIAKNSIRDKLFVATKVWTSGKDAGIAQMEDSIAKLRAKPIDLMQVHNLLDMETHLRTLADWKRQGRVRYIGVTHYTPSAYAAVAKAIETHTVDFLQINYSVGEREAEARLLPMARERGIAVIVNRPFAGGGLIRRLSAMPVPAWAAEIDCGSWAQLLLKFVISHPAVTCAIPATSKIEHLRDNMAAGVGRMPDEKMRALIAVAQ